MPEHRPVRVVAVDGPAGSGKSTVARELARALGWRYVDTGSSYRAATLAVLRHGVPTGDDEAVLGVVRRASIVLSTDPSSPGVLLDGQNVSEAVRGPEVTAAVSAVSAVAAVRTRLVELQRSAIGTEGAVAEGRDVGSVVVPDAGVKVYLDARPAVRAARRAGETGDGPSQVEALVQADLERRDALDSARAASPLRLADDAVHLDTSDLSREEVVQALLSLVRAAGLV